MKLKPCPFCGSKAMVIRNAFENCVIYHIECTGCLGEHARYMESREAAIEAWNTRAERTCRAVMAASKIASTCSECGAMLANWAMRYCPNCGAKVVGE